MPDVSEVFLQHTRDVDATLLQQSVVGWASRCVCGGVKSEIYECLTCPRSSQGVKVGLKTGLDASKWKLEDISGVPLSQSGGTVEKDGEAAYQAPKNRASTRINARGPVMNEGDSRRLRDSSPDPPAKPQRGRPPNGSKPWYPNRFKGVRKRRNVRGFLVEIRPPRWKKTIWLGTYNTDAEAAGAFDAGLFYTKKKIRYNFPMLAKAFPPLPENLALDREEDAEKIKGFVKAQAAEAAAKIKSMNIVPKTTDSSRSPINACNEADNNANDRVVENTSHIPLHQESAQPADLTSHDFCFDQYAYNYLYDQSDYDQYALQDIIHDYFNYHQFTLPVPNSPPAGFGDNVTNLNVGDMADHGVSRMLPSNLDPESEDY